APLVGPPSFVSWESQPTLMLRNTELSAWTLMPLPWVFLMERFSMVKPSVVTRTPSSPFVCPVKSRSTASRVLPVPRNVTLAAPESVRWFLNLYVPGEKQSVLPVFTLRSSAPCTVVRSSELGATVTVQSPASVDGVPPDPPDPPEPPVPPSGDVFGPESGDVSVVLSLLQPNARAAVAARKLSFGLNKDFMLTPR